MKETYQDLEGHPKPNEQAAIGTEALKNITSGKDGIAIGFASLENNTTQFKNTAIGMHAMTDTVTGGPCVPLGEAGKYFTPSIEDIRVGYEYQIKDWWTREGTMGWNSGATEEEIAAAKAWKPTPDGFTRRKLTSEMLDNDDPNKQGVDYRHEWERITTGIKDGTVRVPYLTKEQIEAEGWKPIKKGEEKWFKNERGYGLYFGGAPFYTIDLNGRYVGECKDINTFRYICKLLSI